MSMINNESTTWFDRLPTEIIFQIFNYLSNNDIIYTFFHFSQRLNNLLLENEEYLNILDCPTTNLDLWENIFSIIGSRIERLNIKTIDSSFPLKYFSNLKSMIIYSSHGFPAETMKSIVENDLFQSLHVFKIKEEDIYSDTYITDQDYLFKNVFSNKNSLKTFQYSLSIPLFSRSNMKTFQTNSNLNSLTLILFYFDDIFSLLSYTPNLKYLNVQTRPLYPLQTSANQINIELKQLYLTLEYNMKPQNQRSGPLFSDQLINLIQQVTLVATTRLTLD
jgi:hypothetical protein